MPASHLPRTVDGYSRVLTGTPGYSRVPKGSTYRRYSRVLTGTPGYSRVLQGRLRSSMPASHLPRTESTNALCIDSRPTARISCQVAVGEPIIAHYTALHVGVQRGIIHYSAFSALHAGATPRL